MTARWDVEAAVAAGVALSGATCEIHKSNALHRISEYEDIPLLADAGAQQPEYLLKPELPKSAVVALTGDAGCGKSTLVTAWAGRVAAMGAPVLILDRENPRTVVSERFQRLGVADGERLKVWGGWCVDEPPAPASGFVMTWAASVAASLIVVDSKAAFDGGDENSSSETRAFMHQCRKLADLGACVVVLHHSGKAETSADYRGSSDFKAAIDQGFHVTNLSSDGRLDVLRLRCFKSRLGFTGELVYRYMDGQLVRDEDPGAPKETVTQQLAGLLRMNPGIGKDKFERLAAERGLGRNRARTYLDDGCRSGIVRLERGPKSACRFYLISEEDHAQSKL